MIDDDDDDQQIIIIKKSISYAIKYASLIDLFNDIGMYCIWLVCVMVGIMQYEGIKTKQLH